MTAVEQETNVPVFAHAVRGYDRLQVDEYVERLHEWAAGAQARALEAEQHTMDMARELNELRQEFDELERDRPATPDGALKVAAERASQSVAVAVEQADEIRKRANEEAMGVVQAARVAVHRLNDEVTEERRQGRSEAARIVAEAQKQAEEIRLKADEHRRAVVAELERLKGERSEIMNELARLRAAIHSLIAQGSERSG